MNRIRLLDVTLYLSIRLDHDGWPVGVAMAVPATGRGCQRRADQCEKKGESGKRFHDDKMDYTRGRVKD